MQRNYNALGTTCSGCNAGNCGTCIAARRNACVAEFDKASDELVDHIYDMLPGRILDHEKAKMMALMGRMQAAVNLLAASP